MVKISLTNTWDRDPTSTRLNTNANEIKNNPLIARQSRSSTTISGFTKTSSNLKEYWDRVPPFELWQTGHFTLPRSRMRKKQAGHRPCAFHPQNVSTSGVRIESQQTMQSIFFSFLETIVIWFLMSIFHIWSRVLRRFFWVPAHRAHLQLCVEMGCAQLFLEKKWRERRVLSWPNKNYRSNTVNGWWVRVCVFWSRPRLGFTKAEWRCRVCIHWLRSYP